MNDTLSKVVIFAAGAGIGSVVTWRLVKEYYTKLANEEIADVKAWYARKYGEKSESKKMKTVGDAINQGIKDGMKKPVTETDIRNLTAELQNMGYTNYSDMSGDGTKPVEKNEEKKVDDVERPYVISPDEYDDYDDYQAIELTLYADGVLVDDMNEPIEDVDDIVGLDNLNTFGQHEDDAVHVRNDRRKCDYEILRVLDTYHKNNTQSLHPTEDE